MIRLLLLLCVGLYFSLMILGQDHGQKRYGLMPVAQKPAALEPAIAPTDPEVFIPAQTVMEPPVVAAPEVAVVIPPAAPPEPEGAGGRLFSIAATAANVREGPGTAFAVLGSLVQGEQVLVVDEAEPTNGWSRVRLEGDGVEGFIKSSLLTPVE
jgi:hypothetical protein